MNAVIVVFKRITLSTAERKPWGPITTVMFTLAVHWL